MRTIPYDELDENIVELVRSFNSFPGIRTVGSCGGHENNESYQNPTGTWDVVFQVETENRVATEAGWVSLEFLIYAFNNWFSRCCGFHVYIYAYAPPPQFNEPGEGLSFRATGEADPSEIVDVLMKMKEEAFLTYYKDKDEA